MCANSAVIESIECYMEDMIECFEAFVKRTLLVITVAAGALVAMTMYLLKSVQGRNTHVTGAETQMEQILETETNLQESSSTTSLTSDKKEFRKESYTKKAVTKSEKTLESNPKRTSKDNLLGPKNSRSCCLGKMKCPSSLTKVSEESSPSRTSSRKSSCDSLISKMSSSICSKKPCPAKASCLSSAICSLLPLCPASAACKRTCKPSTCKHSPPLPACTRTCTPIPTCKSTCSRPCGMKPTIPSLITCNQPKYKLTPACSAASIKPCHIPKRISSKCSTKIVEKHSCCSMCCDDQN